MTRAADADRSLPPRRRRIAYRAATAMALLVLAFMGARAWDRWRYPRTPNAASTQPVPPTLRADCIAKDDACVDEIGVAVPICHRRSCVAESGVTTNAQAVVAAPGRVYAVPKPAGVTRILAFGGSTTGNGRYQLMWPGMLEVLLEDAGARDGLATHFEVLNLGVPEAGSRDVAALVGALGRRFEADGIILGEEVNDLGSCATFMTPAPGRARTVQRDVVRAYLKGGSSRDDLEALSPWFARHADAFTAERDRRHAAAFLESAQRALAPGKLTELPETYEQQVARCLRTDTDPPELPTSIFDDYTDGFLYTRASYDAVATVAHDEHANWLAVTTAPHDFRTWKCPTSTCEPVLELHDWRRYLTEVQNPSTRTLARERGWILVDLERALDDYGAGRNDFGLDLAGLLAPTVSHLKMPLDELVGRARSGTLGKRPYFSEWMHPSSEGQAIIAHAYFAALWPTLSGAKQHT